MARPDWVEAFAYGRTPRPQNHNPDSGARNDVINDGMILAAVQAVRAAEQEAQA